MEYAEQIKKFQKFLETEYYDQLLEKVRKGYKFLPIEFTKISKFHPELAEVLLETPEETLKAGGEAVNKLDLEGDTESFNLRIKDLPESQEVMISNLRSKHIDKLIQVAGVVRQKSDVRPQVTSARFECPSCGNIIPVLQKKSKFREPNRCSCGRKSKFRMLSKELVDAQRIVLEEATEDIEGGAQPKRIDAIVKKDLVSPINEKRTSPGSKVKVVGKLNEIPVMHKRGGKSTRFDLQIESNYIEPIHEKFTDIEISSEELKEIREISESKNVQKEFRNSVAPNIYGHQKIKDALVLQLFGGCKKTSGEVQNRGDIHVLLIGDPGAGKSQLLKRVSEVAPKARYLSGKGASGAGLTASVVKDEFLKGWALEAGALVLANKGICCIDELDKMDKDDRTAMHEALEQQTITINKANIQATLKSETTVLAAANPKFGRFDPYKEIPKQIDLPTTLINRFDLIFPIKDLPDEDRDEKMASFILEIHKERRSPEKAEIETDILRKYIAYAKKDAENPDLTEAAVDELKDYYLKMRKKGNKEEGFNTVPINARQLEALVRLAEANSKMRLGKKVKRSDAEKAVELLHFCLKKISIDPETGEIDIDKISTGITASQRNYITVIRDIIDELEEKTDNEMEIEEIIEEAEIRDISKEKTEEIIDKMKRSGDLYSPKRGKISKMK